MENQIQDLQEQLEQSHFDPLKKFEIQSFISQQLIGKLQSQVMRKFGKLYQSPIDDTIYNHLSQTNKDVQRFIILVMEEMQINLELAQLSYIYQPFRKIISFMNTLIETILTHFNRVTKELEFKQAALQNMKEKESHPIGLTVGIIDQQQLQKMRRMQAEDNEREKYQHIDDEEYMRQLQNILKHRIYEQNFKTPTTTHELMDVKERMQQICNFTDRIASFSYKSKIQVVDSQQLAHNNSKLLVQLTKYIQNKFSNSFKDQYFQSININSEKLYQSRVKKAKQSMVSVQTQNPEVAYKKNKEYFSKQIDQKNKIIENLNNRNNLYQKVIEENKKQKAKYQSQIQKQKALCNNLAEKYQQIQSSQKNKLLIHNYQLSEFEQQIKLRDANIRKLNSILQAGGVKVPNNNISVQTFEVEYLFQETQTDDCHPEERIFEKLIQNHVRSRNGRRNSNSSTDNEIINKSVVKRKNSLSQYLIKFLEYLSDKSPQILYNIIQKIEGMQYEKMRQGMQIIFMTNKQNKQQKVFTHQQTQTIKQIVGTYVKKNPTVKIIQKQKTLKYLSSPKSSRRPSIMGNKNSVVNFEVSKYTSKNIADQNVQKEIAYKSNLKIQKSTNKQKIQETGCISYPKQSTYLNRQSVQSGYMDNSNKQNAFKQDVHRQNPRKQNLPKQTLLKQKLHRQNLSRETPSFLKSVNILQSISNPKTTLKSTSTQHKSTKSMITKTIREDIIAKTNITSNRGKVEKNQPNIISNKVSSKSNLGLHTMQNITISNQNTNILPKTAQVNQALPQSQVIQVHQEKQKKLQALQVRSKNKYPIIKKTGERFMTQVGSDAQILSKKLKTINRQQRVFENYNKKNVFDFQTSENQQKKVAKPKRDHRFQTFQAFEELRQSRQLINPKRSFAGTSPTHKRLFTVILCDQSQNCNSKNQK